MNRVSKLSFYINFLKTNNSINTFNIIKILTNHWNVEANLEESNDF